MVWVPILVVATFVSSVLIAVNREERARFARWKALSSAQGLKLSGSLRSGRWSLRGKIEGFGVEAHHRRQRHIDLTLGPVDASLIFQHEFFAEGRVHLQGNKLVLASAVDQAGRQALTEACVAGVVVRDGLLRFASGNLPIEDMLRLALPVARLSRVRSPQEQVDAAATVAATDPDPAARRRTLLALLDAGAKRPDLDVAAQRAVKEVDPDLHALGLIVCGSQAEQIACLALASPAVEARVLLALERDGAPESVFLARLHDAEEEARLAVIGILGRIGTVAAVMPLRSATPRFRRDQEDAIAAIQARLAGAEHGELAISELDGQKGALSEASRAGALSLKRES